MSAKVQCGQGAASCGSAEGPGDHVHVHVADMASGKTLVLFRATALASDLLSLFVWCLRAQRQQWGLSGCVSCLCTHDHLTVAQP